MSMFRAKKLDLGCFINTRIIRDHTKRKVFEQFEPERLATSTTRSPIFPSFLPPCWTKRFQSGAILRIWRDGSIG